jgi:uncharacterized RDD family membrane protein YckC
MVTRDGKLKVTDFGISRTVHAEVTDFRIPHTVEGEANVTKTGTILGTAMYMSPEQAMGQEVDRRSDIYSLGMTAHFLLSGRPPFQGNNALEVLAQQVSDYPPSLIGHVPGLTEERAAILHRMISKNKQTRYADYGELLEDLLRERPDNGHTAGLGIRLAAELTNFFLVAIASLLMSGLLLLDPEIRHFVLHNEAPEVNVIKRLIFASSLFLVYMFGEGKYGRTPGKWWAKIRVTRLDGSRLGYDLAILRYLLKYPALVISPLLELHFNAPSLVRERLDLANLVSWALSAILIWRTAKRRAIHDILTGSVVVRSPQSAK